MKPLSAIRLIVTLMGLALIGLICLQSFWLMRDIKLASQNFERNVKFALNSVLEQYLEKEITSKKHLVFRSEVKSFSADSARSFIYQYSLSNDSLVPKFKIKTDAEILSGTGIDIDEVETINVRDNGKVTIFVENIHEQKVVDLVTEKKVSKQKATVVGNGTNHIDDEINLEYNFNSDNIISQKALDYLLLDSLLKSSMSQQGLPSIFDWAVANPNASELVYQNRKELDKEDIFTGFQFPLTLLGAQPSKGILLLQFPEKNQFILQEIGGMLLASGLLILVVSVAFWLAISTILKQKKLSEIKNDFINNMTHEFKTPISNVALAIEALRNFGMMTKPSTTEKYLDIAQSENKRLSKQVEKVLQMALLEKENFKLRLKTVNIHELADQVAQSFKLQVDQKGGFIKLELEANPENLEADEMHLSNLLFNLVDNANKYSKGAPDITIRTENKTDGLFIKVIDKGVGIAKEHISSIFDKFYRVPTGNLHNVKGFGLGLSYVGQIVQRHGGQIQVKSEPNKGSQFEIFLPYKQEAI